MAVRNEGRPFQLYRPGRDDGRGYEIGVDILCPPLERIPPTPETDEPGIRQATPAEIKAALGRR